MGPVVTQLKKNQLAFKLGEKIVTKGVPMLTITKTGTKQYEVSLKVTVAADDENTAPNPKDLAAGSFAVLSQGADQPILSTEVNVFFKAISNQAGDQFAVMLDGGFGTPGSKGNHAS